MPPKAHEYSTDVFTPGDENHCHSPTGVGIGIAVEKIPELSAGPDPDRKRAGAMICRMYFNGKGSAHRFHPAFPDRT
jgi:hypothetical protein